MEPKRRVWLWLTFGGAAVGGSLTSWLAPKLIAWWFNPPAEYGINCVEPIKWALSRLQWAQGIGTLTGAAIGLTLYFLFRNRRSDSTTLVE